MIGNTIDLGTLFGWGHSMVGDTNGVGDNNEIGTVYGWIHTVVGDITWLGTLCGW